MLEMALSIIVVALPGLKPLIGVSLNHHSDSHDSVEYHEESKAGMV
jgi:hypothetical protein